MLRMPQVEATPLRVKQGQRIRKARKKQDLSLNRLARLAGIDAGNLSRMERGLQDASLAMKCRIATALALRVDELFPDPKTSGASADDAVSREQTA